MISYARTPGAEHQIITQQLVLPSQRKIITQLSHYHQSILCTCCLFNISILDRGAANIINGRILFKFSSPEDRTCSIECDTKPA